MKKLLSILGTIGLTATSTTTLISCDKPNNKNIPCEKQDHGNWKQQCYNDSSFNDIDNKYYIVIWKGLNLEKWNIVKFNNNNEKIEIQIDSGQELWKFDKQLMLDVGKGIILWNNDSTGKIFKSVYRWNGDTEPQIPEIDKNTGKITDWKE
ncbi:lipoprotein [Spiroplasma melliferum]|uniref:Lipoprotein n=2 Tax=Spiroplasma melliferum TaxID=2134 RepID=A0AAI9X1P2_SPIME|nr:lipoprotein [Spiroplasma melliferum]KAI93144.1 hypothetical protein SPM_002240 [Spiroplasma melliferum KC3]QCO24481.1 Spiroplasmavirus-related protein [Spiroplasma melliferum]